MGSSNSYMEEVIQQQQLVAQELKKNRAPGRQAVASLANSARPDAGDLAPAQTGAAVRVTGFWRWKTVIVPPNAWVVHTRRGHPKPLHLGLGVSFSYDPVLDSYLVAPATMQTLAISARCICAERQGIYVQAYVQWIIENFEAAYQKLDFSDVDDPMRIVNVQLREQAEASIKDKVASLSVDEVLADRRPIIDELTSRLRGVAEGQGLKIVQVQIKEAVVSSTAVWESLQKPFREEKARLARLAELERERAVSERELHDGNEAERARIATQSATERLRREQEVELQKYRAELETVRVRAELLQIEAQAKVDAARAQASLEKERLDQELTKLRHELDLERAKQSLSLDVERKKLDNDVSAARLDELLVRALPQIAGALPKPDKSEAIVIGADAQHAGAVALAGLVRGVRSALKAS